MTATAVLAGAGSALLTVLQVSSPSQVSAFPRTCPPDELYTYYGVETKDYFGYSVAGVEGDLDGDGVNDFIVGVIGDDAINNATYYAGLIKVYSGATGALIFENNGDQPGDRLGRAVAGLGDLNGDGVPEVAAGAANTDLNGSESGTVRIYDGATGAVWREHYGDQTYDKMGWAISNAGDVNADGIDDVVAGARMFSDGVTPWGPATSASTPDSMARLSGRSWEIRPTTSTASASMVWGT